MLLIKLFDTANIRVSHFCCLKVNWKKLSSVTCPPQLSRKDRLEVEEYTVKLRAGLQEVDFTSVTHLLACS